MHLAWLRKYPTGLGVRLHHAYKKALANPGRTPLRFKIAVKANSEVEAFEAMPMGDIWAETGMHDVFEYLYLCKHVRTVGSCQQFRKHVIVCCCTFEFPIPVLLMILYRRHVWGQLCRIPSEWTPVLKSFRRDLQNEAA